MPQTGATRYQKFLKSDKAKTKLKSKKDLPKGTNITKTNFKVKKIVLKEQLKTHGEGEALSARKLNIKELLCRINHFNVNARTDALDGVKELITSHPDLVESNLGLLIHGVTPLIINIEKKVRLGSLKVIHLILTNASSEIIEPFFEFLCTYLRSAMTHIDNIIQEDSLLFLDVLLLCTPERVAKDFHKIIPNFLDMISKLRVDSKPGRTLTVNLDSKITSVKWRVKVLHRLQEFLHKYVQINTPANITESNHKTTHYFKEGKENNFPLFDPIYVSNCYLPIFSSNYFNTETLDEVERFKKYVETLMPLLFETWLEVCPNFNKVSNIESVITEDAAMLLKHILQVIQLLWDLFGQLQVKYPSSNITTMLRDRCRKPYSKHILTSFPYVTNIRSKKSNAAKTSKSLVFEDVITDPKMIEQNLAICHLFILLNPKVNIKTQSSEMTAVLDYVEKIFIQNTYDNVNSLMAKILDSIFTAELTGWTRNAARLDPLFNKIITSYFTRKSEQLHQSVFSLLCKIALSDKLVHFHKNISYNEWIKDLPNILLGDTITPESINILHNFAIRNNKVFNEAIKPMLLQIIDNLPKIKVRENSARSQIQMKLFSLLYWIKVWDETSINLIEKQLVENKYSNDHSRFIMDTLKIKSGFFG